MSDITDWEPQMKPDWEDHYAQQVFINGQLILEIENLKKQQRDALIKQTCLVNHQKDLADKFTSFKCDVIVTLKALELCAIASQRDGDISLNHHVRDMRLAHLQSIIGNAIAEFSDRNLTTYGDDF